MNFTKTINQVRQAADGKDDMQPVKVERALEDIKGSEKSIFKAYTNALTFYKMGVNVIDDSDRAGYIITAYSDFIKAALVDEWDLKITADFKWESDGKLTVFGRTKMPEKTYTNDDEYTIETIETTIKFSDDTTIVATSNEFGEYSATSAAPQSVGIVTVTDSVGGVGNLNTSDVTIQNINGDKLKGRRFTASVTFSTELLKSQNKDAEIQSAIQLAIDKEITKYIIQKALAKSQSVADQTLGVAGLCNIEEPVKTSGIYITDPTTFKAGKQIGVNNGYLFTGGKSSAKAFDGQLLFTPAIEDLPDNFGQKVMFGDPSQITVALYGTYIGVDRYTYQKKGKIVLTIDSYAEVDLTSDKAWSVANITG
ncbi:hypothetical protein [Marinifilum sp. D737]|uniref:hypothetical protein n=1 Tax=Marinifilum sp. D737 TaxID=2969628 RepID=UPI002273526A|nr:hypothetical protein [Marinifilum sp. D737]MCY1635065.1 hypothetical protein [Marinifilum sp. D737]